MMENKFTPRAEESLRLAQEAAEEMGHGYVGSEHLLLGLMREEEGIAHRVLEEAGLTDDMICDVLHRSVGTGLSGAAPSQGLTPRAKSAVELAVSEASRTGAGYIGTEHLLMGLLREGNNMAIRVLRTVGIDPKKLYSAVVKKINEAPRAAAAAGSGSAAPAREDGKKGGAQKIDYEAFSMIQEKTGNDPLETFEKAMENIMPSLECKTRRVGGANYQVPLEVSPARRETLGLRWLTAYSRSRGEKTMAQRLAAEIMDAANNTGNAVKKREDTHKMAEANKAFAHFRY